MNKKVKNKKKNIAILAIAVVFVLFIAVWSGTLLSKNAKLNRELGDKQDQLAAWQEENAALSALVMEENETALMEEYARKTGFVYPDERVYINGN